VSLEPREVDAIVFWTRNPRPLFPHLKELDERGYRYYFLYTLMANPRQIDPGSPPVKAAMETFRALAGRIGPQRVIWRYDPIFMSSLTDIPFHLSAYEQIATGLKGSTLRSVLSVTHMYRKIQKRVGDLTKLGIEVFPCDASALSLLIPSLSETARRNGMELRSCADELALERFGIRPGACVDAELISRISGADLEGGKDLCQRKQCGCAASKDIGMYDSCLFGCIYCYATTSFERAKANHGQHDPASPSLLPCPQGPIID
jgi:hypothetical protein